MKYYLIVVDDFTHYMSSFLLRSKSDVHATLSHFHALIRTHFNTVIATIQCDNGKEFDNHPNTFLVSHTTTLLSHARTLSLKMVKLNT
jgi:hypothetical protein